MTAMTWRHGSALVLTAALVLAAPLPLTAGERQVPSKEPAGTRAPAVRLAGQVWRWMANVWGQEGGIIIPDGFSVQRDGRLNGDTVNDRPAAPASRDISL